MTRRRSARIASLAVIAVCCVALVTSCTSDTHTASGDNQGFVSGDGTTTVVGAADREPAPDVSGTTLQGDQLALSDYKGDVVVLNVWGSWCAPCRSEAQTLQELSKKYANKGVQFVGINTRDNEADARAYERHFGITYPSLIDTDGQLQLQFYNTIPPSAIPSTLVIDKQGRVAARILGPATYAQLDGLIQDVVSDSKSS